MAEADQKLCRRFLKQEYILRWILKAILGIAVLGWMEDAER
jgi:hypothetical protein